MNGTNNTGEMRYDRRYDEPRGRGIGCRPLGCGCLFVLLIICFGSIFLIVSKPKNIWSSAVDILNDGLTVREYKEVDPKLVQNKVNSQITSVESINISIDEDELTSLAREKIPSLQNLVLDMTQNKVTFTWDLDKTIEDKPLKGILEFDVINANEIKLTKIGTNRLHAPDFLKDFISQTILSIKNPSSDEVNNSFLNSFFSNSQIHINSINIDDTTLTINGKINVDIFN